MKRNSKYNFLSILILFVLALTSCGGSGSESDSIATAVAMTVAARDTQQAQATPTPKTTGGDSTSTPSAKESATPTKPTAATFSPPTAPAASTGSGEDSCLIANFVSETIPDGQIMQPGENFWKSWRLVNNGSCTWDASYKIVHDSGDLMGGLYEYPFPGVAGPGEEIDISIYMKAPSENGNYKSNWKIQSPWGGTFGVGQYGEPFYVQVNVNDDTNPDFGVTNVSYNIVRDPPAGCFTNQWYYVHATITTNGPITVKYQWLQKDGNNSGIKTLKFTQADSITITREWKLHLADSPGEKWMQIIIHEPVYQEYPKATWVFSCQ
jgi:hypothetical protein